MAEFLEEASGLESTTVGIYRTSATVKGGRRFSFGALVVVGDRRGSVGLGYAKAPGVPAAIEKAQKAARKVLKKITLQEGTLPHAVTGRFKSASVKLIPASAGTGVIAGATVRAVLEMAGIHDCLSKSVGSTNQQNLAKAAMAGLQMLVSHQQIEELRGVSIGTTRVDEMLEAGRRWAPKSSGEKKAIAPKAKESSKGKGRGGQRGRGGGGRSDSRRPAMMDRPTGAPTAPAPPPADGGAPASE